MTPWRILGFTTSADTPNMMVRFSRRDFVVITYWDSILNRQMAYSPKDRDPWRPRLPLADCSEIDL